MVPRLATLGLLVLFACSSNGAVEGSVDTYANTVYIAPTWDLTADGPAEVDEALIRQGLTEIRNAFGTGLAHGPHAQPGITFYCLYEGPLAYRLAQDAALLRNLRLAVELGLPYRVILHGGQFTGTDCLEEPLQCFLKQTADEWLLGDPDPFRVPMEGADSPPYVTFSRYNSVYYVRKMRNLRAAVRDLLAWVGETPRRRELFIGLSKDPETVMHPSTGQTTDPLALLEFEAWRSRAEVYDASILTVPVDHHAGATGVASVRIGPLVLGRGEFGFVGWGQDTPRRLEFALILIDRDALANPPPEFSEASYVVEGGSDAGRTFSSMVWRFSDDPEGDGGEWMRQSTGTEEGDYRSFMRAMVDHHVEDVLAVIFDEMRRSAVFRDDAEIRSYLYSHEVPGGDWAGLAGPNADDYELIRRFAAPLLPDPAGNWSSVAGSRWASAGIDVFGVLTRDREIFDAARSAAAAGNWGLMEWNPTGQDPEEWRASLALIAEHGVHVVSLQGWEEIADSANGVARQALADFLIRMGRRPYRVGGDNR
ncbi:MAG: hypothetical protein ACYS0K_20815 [Planctomycetota bacterium]